VVGDRETQSVSSPPPPLAEESAMEVEGTESVTGAPDSEVHPAESEVIPSPHHQTSVLLLSDSSSALNGLPRADIERIVSTVTR
jgi:hypothetical protein